MSAFENKFKKWELPERPGVKPGKSIIRFCQFLRMKGIFDMVEGSRRGVVRTEDGDLHRHHANQIIALSQPTAVPSYDLQPNRSGLSPQKNMIFLLK